MNARVLLALVLGAQVSACEAVPNLNFVEDASTEDVPTPAVPPDATIAEASVPTIEDASDDAPSSTPDAGLACLSAEAPDATQCCPNGNPCIGPACGFCNQCNCGLGDFCCAKESGGGHVQGTECSNAATASQCPTQ